MNVSHAAIRAVDRDHMILGSRLLNVVPAVVLAEKPYVDVVDLHMYDTMPSHEMMDHAYQLTGHPILVSEFGFRAMDSGLPNTKGWSVGRQ